MATLVLILGEKPEEPAVWGVFDKSSPRLRRSGALRPGEAFTPADGATPDRVWVIVPGACVITRTVALPPQIESRARKAAAFMLEDDLAADSEDLHFALTPATPEGSRTISVVAHDTMKSWLSRLAESGLKPDVLVPDYLAVPAAPHDVTIVGWRGSALVRPGPGDIGFTIETGALAWVLDETLVGKKAVRLMSDNAGDLLSGPLRTFRSIIRQEPLSDEKMLEEVYAALLNGVNVNLLVQDYAPRRNWSAIGHAWRRAAVLAGVAVALGVAFLIVDGVRLNRHAAAALVRADTVFRQTLPEVKRVVNPRSQIRAHLRDLKARTSTGFLQLADMLFFAVSEIDGAEIDSLRFDAKRGEAMATLSLPSYDAIESAKKALLSRGGVVQEGGARQADGRVVADITVRLP